MSKNLKPCQMGFVEETIDYLESIKLSKFFCPSEHKYVDYAIDAVRRAASEANEALTCNGCTYQADFPSHAKCHGCARSHTDHYRRPPEGLQP